MNWRRGLFRLWLAVSALWIGACVLTIVWFGPAERYRSWKEARETLAQLEAGVECGPWLYYMVHDPSELPPPPEGFEIFVTEEECVELRSEAKSSADHSVRAFEGQATFAVLGTVVPPLALLALFLIGSWVLRGFRRS